MKSLDDKLNEFMDSLDDVEYQQMIREEHVLTILIRYKRDYKKKLKQKDEIIERLRDKVEKVRDTKKSAIKGALSSRRKVEKRIYRITQGRINKRAKDIYYKKVRDQVLRNSKTMGGGIMFPLILAYTEEKKINPIYFSIITIMYSHEWIETSDLVYFTGYKIERIRKVLFQMQRQGWAEKYAVKAGVFVYSASTKAKEMFDNFNQWAEPKFNEIFKEYDKQHKLDYIFHTAPDVKHTPIKTPILDETTRKTISPIQKRVGVEINGDGEV